MNLKLSLPFLLVLSAPLTIRAQRDPPGIDQATHSVNMLLGIPPDEQRLSTSGGIQIFQFSKGFPSNVNGFKKYPEMGELNDAERCKSTSTTRTNWWSTSESSLREQFTSDQSGIDQSTDLGVTIPAGSAEVSAKTTIRSALGKKIYLDLLFLLLVILVLFDRLNYVNHDKEAVVFFFILGNSSCTHNLFRIQPKHLNTDTDSCVFKSIIVFGNSDASKDSFQKRKVGMTHSINAFAKRNLYNVKVDYNKVRNRNSWTIGFKRACKELGTNPSQNKLLVFFSKYGTHGLEKVSFGQKCRKHVFMEGGQTSDKYNTFASKTKSYDASKWPMAELYNASACIVLAYEYGYIVVCLFIPLVAAFSQRI